MDPEQIERLQAKTPEHKFLYLLTQEYHYAPRIAEAILKDAQACLEGNGTGLKPGQVRYLLTQRKARGGQALSATPSVEVIWTVDAGAEDLAVLKQKGRQALRQLRLQRLVEEALDQEGVATQEDLAHVLHTSLRTIKRDVHALLAQGMSLATRGDLQGIGRGQTHKVAILQRWLQGETYDQIARHTHHSLSSIQRYVHAFVQVQRLHRLGYTDEEVAHLLQIGLLLVGVYLQVAQGASSPACQARLDAQLQRLGQNPVEKKGAQ